MSVGASLLATYLDQRRRMGEPGLVPGGTTPAELTKLARAAKGSPAREALSPARESLEPGAGRISPSVSRRSPARPRRPAARASAAGPATAPAEAAGVEKADYDELRRVALACTRCGLAERRKQVVFADGNPAGRLMVVGEAPGAQEDATGLPFVGQAGKLLDLMLASVGLSRQDSVYICNVLKCRPPGNRNPAPPEIEACAPFLKRQIELVAPEVVLATGTFAAKWLTSSKETLGKLRGKVHSWHGVPLVVTYHPAALLRNPGWSRPAWDDLQLLRQVMDG